MSIWPEVNPLTPEEKEYPDDGYLSKNKLYLARRQRERRARKIRIDYQDVDPKANEIIESLRFNAVGGDASSILNRIVLEWAEKNDNSIS